MKQKRLNMKLITKVADIRHDNGILHRRIRQATDTMQGYNSPPEPIVSASVEPENNPRFEADILALYEFTQALSDSQYNSYIARAMLLSANGGCLQASVTYPLGSDSITTRPERDYPDTVFYQLNDAGAVLDVFGTPVRTLTGAFKSMFMRKETDKPNAPIPTMFTGAFLTSTQIKERITPQPIPVMFRSLFTKGK